MTPLDLQEQLDPERPLIICDVDEVILHFIRHFEAFLERHGYQLKANSYSLNGNICDINTGSNLSNNSIKDMINSLFMELSSYQEAVENSISALAALQKKCNLLLLTNFPDALADKRRNRLAQLGLVAPLLTNQGSKGPKIAQLMEHQKAPTFFLDDSSSHISSALGLANAPVCLHFIADSRFASIASQSPVAGTALLCRDWQLVQHYIERYIG